VEHGTFVFASLAVCVQQSGGDICEESFLSASEDTIGLVFRFVIGHIGDAQKMKPDSEHLVCISIDRFTRPRRIVLYIYGTVFLSFF
jgi:hypothetical protein